MKKKLLIGLLLGLNGSLFAQKDTTFWFAVPEVTEGTIWYLDRNIVLRFLSFNEQATVTVTQPAAGGMVPQTITVPANGATTLDLTEWIDSLETKPANTVLNYGLKITSTKPILAYYEVLSGGNGMMNTFNPEVFSLKGKNALGTSFIIPGQNALPNYLNDSSYIPLPYNSFDIVATQNNTTVTILPSADVVGHPAGLSYTITLQQGQSYSATATSQSADKHLDGSVVTATKPIAVTVKDDLLDSEPLYGGCEGLTDLTGDQIVPVDILGEAYIAISGGELYPPGDYIFVTATQNNTEVRKGGVPVATIAAGETYSFAMNNDLAVYITASAPVAVWQLSGSSCEVGATILPQINNTGSDSVVLMRNFNTEHKVNLLVPGGSEDAFTINGNTISPGLFSAVPGTNGNWKAVSILLPADTYPTGDQIIVTNSESRFHLSTLFDLNGIGGGGASYSYFSDYGITPPVVGIDEEELLKQSIGALFPNPASNEVSFIFNNIRAVAGDKVSIEVYAPDGRKVSSEQQVISQSGRVRFKVNELPPGIYFCEIGLNNNKIIRKFVKL